MEYFVYMLECGDGTFYTGITTDVPRRLREHLSGAQPGAKYTRAHPPVALRALWRVEGRSLASRVESGIKKLDRARKEHLVSNPECLNDIVACEASFYDDAFRSYLWHKAIED